MAKQRDNHAASVNTGQINRRLSIADGVDASAKDGSGQQHHNEDADARPDPQRVRNAEYRPSDGNKVHHCRRVLLRGETACVNYHQSLGDRVRAEGEDHRRHAKIGDTYAIDETDAKAASDTDGDSQRRACLAPACRRGRHHAANRYDPGNREIDLAKEDDQHEAGGDNAEERRYLELLQQIIGGKKVRRVDGPDEQKRDDAAEGCQDHGINQFKYATSHRCLASLIDIQLILNAKQPEGAEAYRDQQNNAEEERLPERVQVEYQE